MNNQERFDRWYAAFNPRAPQSPFDRRTAAAAWNAALSPNAPAAADVPDSDMEAVITDLMTAGDLLSERWKARSKPLAERLIQHAETLRDLVFQYGKTVPAQQDDTLLQIIDAFREHLPSSFLTAIAERKWGEIGTQDDTKACATFDLIAHLYRQRAWSERTFGPGSRAQGVVDHIRKELREVEADPGDLKEWIDVAILAFDGAWRCGAIPEMIVDALVAKQVKNEGRTWPDWHTMDPTKAIEHDRSADVDAPQPTSAQPAKPVKVPSDEALPTQNMVIVGFEAVSLFHDTDAYKDMSGCQGAAESARICWAAMVAEMPVGATPRQDLPPSEAAIRGLWAEASFAKCGAEAALWFAQDLLARYGVAQPAAKYDPHAENSAFHEWWDANQACPEHTLITENAAHATWQERAKRAAQPAASAEPVYLLGEGSADWHETDEATYRRLEMRGTRPVRKLYAAPVAAQPSVPDGLIAALRNQRQIDRDGSEVAVSRQAVDEAADLLDRYATPPTDDHRVNSTVEHSSTPLPADVQAQQGDICPGCNGSGEGGEVCVGEKAYEGPCHTCGGSGEVRPAQQDADKVDADPLERLKNSRMTPYGLLIRALRIVAGTTLMEMSIQCGVTPAQLSAMEFGRRKVTEADLEKAGAFFSAKGVDVRVDLLTYAARPQRGAQS